MSTLPLTAPPKQEKAASLQAQQQRLARADTLLQSPDFQWFMSECLIPRFQEAEKDALDRSKSKDDRDVALCVRDKLEEIKDWVQSVHLEARKTIETLSREA